MNTGSTDTSETAAFTGSSRPMYYRQAQYPRPPHQQTHENKGSLKTIFVGKVDYEATPQELQELFERCGPIERIKISYYKTTGLPKGHAFIEYKNEMSAARALDLNYAMFHGRPLKVTAAHARGRG